MNTILLVIGFLLLADALFTWANFDRVQKVAKMFPRLNIKLFASIEAIIGLTLLLVNL